ncbi:MAG: hypothetical protein ACXVMS_13780 [Flavisolibacter sp.]
MTYQTAKYRIDIFDDKSVASGSSHNVNNYDLIYFNKSEYIYPSAYGIKVFDDNKLLKSAIIGSNAGGTYIHSSSAVIEDDRVVICCADTIFCLSIPNLELLWRCEGDDATCFEIFKHDDSYIIHGEIEISRIDAKGNIMWQRSGGDIFTTPDGLDTFIIAKDYILATDWKYRKYKFNFDGEILD